MMCKQDTMALLFVCIAVQLVFLCPSTNAAENDSCIRTYEELRRALHDNETNNMPTLLNAFHPPNSRDIQIATVKYCISENKTFCSDENSEDENSFIFKWTANAFLLVQECELINALVMDLFQFSYTTKITLIISPPFCDDVRENEIIDDLRYLTTWLQYYAHQAHGHSDYMLQGYAVHLNDQESTFDITVYGKIEQLHYALLALQYTAVSVIFITLLLRIRSRRFANEINKKLDRVGKSFSKISRGVTEDVTPNNQKNKSAWEYTIPYFLSLAIFIGWDLVQYKNAKKISKTEWFFFFPIPCIAPIIIGVSFGVSILLFIWYCTPLGNYVKKKCKSIRSSEKNKGEEGYTCKSFFHGCRFRDIVHFPILTGLSVFFVFHGLWMLLMFGAYPNLVIIKSLFLLPLFFFIIALLPRMIKGLYNLYIDCAKINKYKSDFCTECKKCKNCKNCENHYNCKNCTKCDTCKERKKCEEFKKCKGCDKCACDNCSSIHFEQCSIHCEQCSIHCEQCTLCEECKKCEKCIQCDSCKWNKQLKKDFTSVYGFSVTALIAIPLLIVLYFASDYILAVTDIIHDDPLKLLITLAVILGVPYYLILLWDSDNQQKTKTKKETNKNGPEGETTNNGPNGETTNNGPEGETKINGAEGEVENSETKKQSKDNEVQTNKGTEHDAEKGRPRNNTDTEGKGTIELKEIATSENNKVETKETKAGSEAAPNGQGKNGDKTEVTIHDAQTQDTIQS